MEVMYARTINMEALFRQESNATISKSIQYSCEVSAYATAEKPMSNSSLFPCAFCWGNEKVAEQLDYETPIFTELATWGLQAQTFQISTWNSATFIHVTFS